VRKERDERKKDTLVQSRGDVDLRDHSDVGGE
jgi:hypothetical protein